MAWNPSPKVAAARDYGKKFNKKIVIIVEIDDENFGVITYGETKGLCAEAKKIADEIHNIMTRA